MYIKATVVDISLKLTVCTLWMHIGGMEAQLHSLSTSGLDGGERSSCTPAALPSGRQVRYQLNKSLGGLQSLSGLFGVEKILLPPPGGT